MKTSSGFTLIELIMTIAVIGIVSTIFTLNYNSMRASQELSRDRQKVTSALRQLQTDALGPPIDDNDICRVDLNIDESSDTLEWEYWTEDSSENCTDNIDPFPGRDDVELVAADITTAPNTVSFRVPFGELSTPNNTGPTDLELEFGGETQIVTIYPSGYIIVKP